MSKFKAGDVVMFKAHDGYGVAELSRETELDLYEPQTVEFFDEDGDEVRLEGDCDFWDSDYWEPVEEWEKHQRKVAPETELELAKMQIKMLQELKFDTQQSVEDLFCAIRDGADKEWLLQFMKQYPFNVEINND